MPKVHKQEIKIEQGRSVSLFGEGFKAGLSKTKGQTLSRLAEPKLSEQVTIMQDEDIKLLRRIVNGGGRKYTAGNIDRSRYDRLVDLGWLTPFKTNISDVEYQVTEKGRAASVANVHD
jgi:hypothetical protein